MRVAEKHVLARETELEGNFIIIAIVRLLQRSCDDHTMSMFDRSCKPRLVMHASYSLIATEDRIQPLSMQERLAGPRVRCISG